MKNKHLIIIIVILFVISIISSPRKTTSFNNVKKPIKEEIVLNVLDKKTNEIIKINLEDYVIGVVSGEMPASFSEEALKAQAIASRTYAIFKLNNNNGKSYDLVTDITNQVYLNSDEQQNLWKENYEKYHDKISKCVKDTEGLVMKYNDEVIASYYFAYSNGKTEDVEYVFKDNKDYLKSVESTEGINITNEVTMSKEEFCSKLNIECNDIKITNKLLTTSNRVDKIDINNKTFNGTEIRKLLNLKSTDFDIKYDNNIIITTKGYGHGVGMSQYGANYLAKNGKTYEEILKYYYQNINISKINV